MLRRRKGSLRSFVAGASAATAALIGLGAIVGAAGASSPPDDTTVAQPVRESGGSATAEEAVSAYLDGLRAADLSTMVGAFAIETYAANYDFAAYLEVVGAYTPTAPVRLPSSNPFNVAINTESRAAQVVNTILFQYLTLCCPELDPLRAEVLVDDTAVTAFVDDLATRASSDVLASIDSFTFVPLEDVSPEAFERYESDPNQANIARRAAVLGADELADVAARFSTVDGDVYALFTVVRYGDRWWLSELGGTFAMLLDVDLSAGGIVPVDEVSATD